MAEPLTNLPAGMTPEMLERSLARNPGATPETVVKEYLLWRSEEEAKPLGTVIREAYAGVAQPVTEAVGEGLGRLFQGGRFFQGMGETEGLKSKSLMDPATGGYKAAGEALAKTAVPQSPEALALMVAAGPVARMGVGAVGGLTRLGTMGAVGGATAGLTGGDPVMGTLEGLGAQGLGEGLRIGASIPYWWRRHMGTHTSRVGWARQDATDAVRGMAQDIPPFLRAFPGSKNPAEALARLTQSVPGGKGRKTFGDVILSEATQDAEDAAVRVLGGGSAMVSIPSIAVRHGLPTGGMPQVTVKEALNELKLATQDAMKAKGASGHAIQANAAEMRQEILAAISRQSPEVAQAYDGALRLYGKGKAFLTALEDSGALQGAVRTGTEDVFMGQKFLDYMTESGTHGYLPNTSQALRRGGPITASDVERTLPRFRAYKAGESATAALPAFRHQVRGGWKQPLYDFETGLKIPTISTMVGANAASGFVAE